MSRVSTGDRCRGVSKPAHLVVLEHVPATYCLSRVEDHHADGEGVEQRREEERHVDLLEQVFVVVLHERIRMSGDKDWLEDRGVRGEARK